MAYVAETDEQAEREYIDHIRFDFALPWAETHGVLIPFHPASASPATTRRSTRCRTTSCSMPSCSTRSGSTGSR